MSGSNITRRFIHCCLFHSLDLSTLHVVAGQLLLSSQDTDEQSPPVLTVIRWKQKLRNNIALVEENLRFCISYKETGITSDDKELNSHLDQMSISIQFVGWGATFVNCFTVPELKKLYIEDGGPESLRLRKTLVSLPSNCVQITKQITTITTWCVPETVLSELKCSYWKAWITMLSSD